MDQSLLWSSPNRTVSRADWLLNAEGMVKIATSPSLIMVLSGTVVFCSRARMVRRFWAASVKLIVTVGDDIARVARLDDVDTLVKARTVE